jgi:oxygen-independent coproporphyrinogen-3 oxidase
MIPSPLLAHDRRVPRYTSYPTAPHFHAAIGPERAAGWLDALDPGRPLSLYLHVPFCDRLCWYCGCNTKIVARYAPIAEFRDDLAREIDLVADRLPGRFSLSHLHWGGGTPTMLAPDDFQALTDRIARRFDIAGDAEIAIEIDPRNLSAAMAAALSRAGVTRASLGVQDFDAAVQRAVNRIQPYPVTAMAVERLRAAGIAAINLDLIYGLPLQTVDSVLATIDQAATLAPQRIALFGYAHVPWMKRHQRLIDERALPDTAERWRQEQAAAARLQAHGYAWIGLDHFARAEDPLAAAAATGRLRRNFQGYTTDRAAALIGLGPSAIGTLPQGHVQNATDARAWREAVRAGRLATARGIALTAEDRLRGDVIERLMCDLGVDLGAVAARHGRDAGAFAAERPALAHLAEDGLITLDGNRIALTALGRPLMRVVAAVFDEHLEAGGVRHAKAV